MTREEAIIRLKVLSVEFSEYKPLEEAFDMAIKALEQTQPRKSIGLGQGAHVEQERIKEICKVAHIDDTSDLSDGHIHLGSSTFRE